MELSARRRALVLPDLASWLLWGEDPIGAGLLRVVAPERAEVMLAPERLPAALAEAARDAWARMPPPRRIEARPSPLRGAPVEEALGGDHPAGGHSHAGDGHGDAHDMAGGHDHHDMMAVVGEPSSDGLVMEDIELVLGPLSPSLSGGLVVELSLDGDVVASAQPRATLHVGPEELGESVAPDALAPLSWQVAMETARRAPSEAERRRQILIVEVERALSHAAWLQTLGHALGWPRLADGALSLARTLVAARAAASSALEPASVAGLHDALAVAAAAAEDLRRPLASRVACRRLRGLAWAGADAVGSRGIAGPVARAAGLDADARRDDPLYTALGFEPVLAQAGDAEARTTVRARELRSSLQLAAAALDGADPGRPPLGAPPQPRDAAVVEGPRGPLRATVGPSGAVEVAAPGAAALLELAGEAVAGLELGAAIAGLVSFDLSPWRVGA